MKIRNIVCLVIAGFSFSAWADLESMRARLPSVVALKDKGVVGERRDGFLGIVKDEAGAKEIVDAENSDRLAEYKKRAAAQNQTVETLEKVLGEARIRQEKAGRMVQDAAGQWSKKE